VHRVRADALPFDDRPGRRVLDPLEDVDAGALSVRYSRLRPGPRSPHRHPGCVEVIHVLEGEGTAWLDGETTHVSAGDFYVIPAGVPHCTVPDADNDMLLLCAFPVADLAAATEELAGPVEL
jgi:quercetin dioxygenase-like cupin family protein